MSIVNLAVCVAAFATAFLTLLVLKSRMVPVLTLALAGVLCGVELCQFVPFAYPLASPLYVVVGGILAALIPMTITLFLLAYIFSKRKDPAPVDLVP